MRVRHTDFQFRVTKIPAGESGESSTEHLRGCLCVWCPYLWMTAVNIGTQTFSLYSLVFSTASFKFIIHLSFINVSLFLFLLHDVTFHLLLKSLVANIKINHVKTAKCIKCCENVLLILVKI